MAKQKEPFTKNSKSEFIIPLWKLCKDYGINFNEIESLHCPQKRSFGSNWKKNIYVRITTINKVISDLENEEV